MKMSFLDGLQLIFIFLKLAGYIDWSWWLVLMPFWGFTTLLVINNLINN